ncbi:MAG TPA: cation diffusion facilitator family transporter [Geobacteraceae bacterium]|nr:cation diffusion facilitator family transporter [Geobacteraceae bacterium]
MERAERFSRADRIIKVGFWFNALLMVMKLLAGHFGRSEAVFADGMESACDFIAILSTMIALHIGSKPFDESHPYGHGRAENLSAILVSLIIFSTGCWILYKSVITIVQGESSIPEWMAVLAALLTIIIKEWLYRFSMKSGSRLESPALLAVAKDHRKDAITSVATLVGVSGAFFGITIMDPLAAGLTSFFIFHIAWETFRSAAHDLMDGQPEEGLLRNITSMAESVEGVEHVHEIRGRRSGQYLIIDLKLDMDPEMTVKESHAIATRVKKVIFDRYHNVGDVMIHINPHDEEHEDLIRL